MTRGPKCSGEHPRPVCSDPDCHFIKAQRKHAADLAEALKKSEEQRRASQRPPLEQFGHECDFDDD